MLKKSLLLMLLMALLAPWAANAHTRGTNTLLSENFDDMSSIETSYSATDWFAYKASGDNNWSLNTSSTYAYSGSKSARYNYTDDTDANCYLVSAPFNATMATLYVSLFERVHSKNYPEEFEVFLVKASDVAAAHDVVSATQYVAIASASYTNTTYAERTGSVTDNELAGQSLRIVVHCTSESGMWNLYIDDIVVTEPTTNPYIDLDPTSATVFTGFTETLTASYGNVTGTPTITYSSSNNQIASVTGSGTTATVTGVSAGTATITATMTYNATDYTATCAITVEEPSYCSPNFSDPSDDHITNFTTTGGETNINNSSTYVSGGYSDYYATVSASIQAGETLSCTVTPSSTSYAYGHAIWVDWNRNYEFENDERVAYSTSTAVGDWTGEFEVPSTTAAGDYRLRVIHLYNNNVTNPCHSATYGEGEDYKLTVTAANPYQKPVNLQVSELAATSATITWEAPNSDVQSYKYQYREAGGSWSDLTSTTALSAPLTVLTGNTNYEFQVQAIYAGNNESGFASKTFTTLIAVPYEYGFEDESELDCWTVLNPVDNTYYSGGSQNWGATGIINNSDSYSFGSGYARTGDNCFLFTFTDYPDVDPQYQCLISPQITGIANGLHVEFYYRQYSNGVESFRVGYSTTDKNISSFTWGSQVENLTAEYQRFSANYPAGTKYVAIQHTSDNQYMIYIDDITFEEVASCLEPTGVTADNITTTGAEITWTNGGEETAWDIFVTTDHTVIPNELTTPTTAGITVKPHPLTSLTPATRYYVYVRSACSSTETSAWSTPYVFDTDCIAEDLPYSYGFENPDQYNICWNIINTNTSYLSLNISTTTSNAHTGNNSLYYYRGSGTGTMIAVLPEFDANYPLNEYEITFWAKGGGTFAIGIMTDPDDASTFVQQGENISFTSSYTQYLVRFNGYTGSGQYIGIKEVSTSNVGSSVIDDIAINHLPSCIEPDDLTVTSPTAHGATFGWTPNGTETEWHLYFGKNNTAPADDIPVAKVTVADSNPFTITTGLDAETDYYVWVRASCGGTDGNSSWVGPETFTTEVACPAPTGLAASEITGHTAKLSWTGTNESYNVRYRTAASVDPVLTEDFENETHYNNNWTVVNLSTANTPGRNSNAGHNSSYGFRFSSYSSASTYEEHLINTNELTGLTNGVIEFYYKKTNSSTETFAVGYSSTDKETTSFSFGANVTATTSWKLFHEEIPAGTKYVSIKYTTTGCYYYIYIDDIVIGNVIPAGTWQTVNPAPDSSPCTISDLSAETKYEAQVQGNCGSEGTSQWTSSVFFTTDIACPAPTGLTASNPKSNSFDLQWTNGGAEDWVLAYKVDGAADFTEMDLNVSDVTEEAGTISYTLGGLEAETDYIVKVRDNCEPSYAGDGVSEWTAEVPYSTIAACSALNPVVDPASITHHNATVTWEGESASGFTVNYRTAESPKSIFFEGFETYADEAALEAVWTVIDLGDGANTSELGLYSGAAKTDDYGFRFSSYNKASTTSSPYTSDDFDQYLISPELTVNGVLGFAYKSSSGTSDVFRVGYSSTTNDLSAFTWGDQINSANSWKTFSETMPAGTKYFAINYMGLYAHRLYIDDINIYVTNPAGAWQTEPAATTTANLTGLTAGTMYDVKIVPNCDNTIESNTVQFTTMSANEKQFITAGDWATATNWLDGEMPTITDNAIIKANATINNGTVAAAKQITFQGSPTPTLTIENGGQLQHDNTSTITATVKKTIAGYGEENFETNNGYVLFAPPFGKSIYTSNSDGTGLRNGTYDLYSWSRTARPEWINYGANNTSSLSMSRGTGYLYANQATTEVTFTGSIYGSGSKYSKSVYYTEPMANRFQDWNLIGNPFVCNAYLATETGTPLAYYKMNEAGNGFTAVTGDAIAPMEGVFYQATESGNVYFFRELPVGNIMPGNLNINLTQAVTNRGEKGATDNAIIRFGEGNTLEKFSFNANNAKVYIPQEGKDYAVVNAANEGEMPVYFKAAENGNYSISFNAENVEFSYLHLIDNLTGNEVNLLETPSYSFDARTIDYASRFKLVFSTNSNSNSNDDNDFAFFDANGNLLILGNEGTATLQVIDITGRTVSNETFSGNYSKAINAKAGVYMLRLIQGNDVRTQKIVVR